MTAQFWGAGDRVSIRKSVTIMLRICMSIVAAFTLVTIFFPYQIMHIFTDAQDVIEKGVIYFRWSIPQYFLLGTSLTLTMVLRSLRKVHIPLIASIISFFLSKALLLSLKAASHFLFHSSFLRSVSLTGSPFLSRMTARHGCRSRSRILYSMRVSLTLSPFTDTSFLSSSMTRPPLQ